jgi:predicted metalloendopeptidase
MNSQSHLTINSKGRIEELEDLLDEVFNIQLTDNTWKEAEEAREAVRELIVKAFQLGYGAKQLPQKNVFDIDFYLQCRSAKQALLTELKEWRLNQCKNTNKEE